MPTLFEKIVAGEIPCHKVWEDEHHLAFLDINPRVEGHTLVIPKQSTDYFFDLSGEAMNALWAASAKVADKLKSTLGCKRVVVGVWGYEIPHVHVHLFPTFGIDDIPMPTIDDDAKGKLNETAEKLKV